MTTKKGRVLCVDDEPGILRSLKWLLQREFDVTTAPGGAEGLALVREQDFDVIISDQRMPGMTGVEFLREACRIAPRAMRILLTGYSDLEAVTRSVNESEIFRFINKPWHVNELPEIVAEAARIAQTHPAPTAVPLTPEPVATPGPAPAAANEALAPAELPMTSPEMVLVIDDDPQLAEIMRQLLGPKVAITQSTSLAEAVAMLASEEEVGLVISDTHVAGADATRLLKLLKERRPGIVTIAFCGQLDAREIISLVNQGQVYRFVQKPVKPGYLKLVLTSALLKRQQLRDNPEFTMRHAVEKIAGDVREAFAGELQRIAASAAPRLATTAASNDERGPSWMQRVSSGFHLLFG